MKPVTITALVAFLVGIPFIIRKLQSRLRTAPIERGNRYSEEDSRYAIDELLT